MGDYVPVASLDTPDYLVRGLRDVRDHGDWGGGGKGKGEGMHLTIKDMGIDVFMRLVHHGDRDYVHLFITSACRLAWRSGMDISWWKATTWRKRVIQHFA